MKSLFSFLKTTYYRIFFFIFKFESRERGWMKQSDKESAFLSIITLSVLLLGNVYMFDFIVFRLYFHVLTPTILLDIVTLAFFVFSYIVIVRKEKYIEIKELFSNEPRKVKRRRRFWCWVYVIISLFGFPIVGLFSELLKAKGIIG